MTGTILILLILSVFFVLFVFTFAQKPKSVVVFEEVRNPQVLQILVPRENDHCMEF